MHITDAPIFIHDAIERHAPKFEKIDFLAVLPRNLMIWIGQTDIGDIFLCPIAFKGIARIGTDSYDLHTPGFEVFIMVAHARQLRATVRSHEAAQKSKDDGFVSAKV